MLETLPEIVRVDLSERSVSREPVPESWRRRFVGGKGLAARYLYDELDAGVDPLGPENAILLFRGPLTGLLPGENRYVVVTKSPLTGTFLDSYAGGAFPGRFAGALGDAAGILVTGQADEPVEIVVADGSVGIESTDLWGAETDATAEARPDAAVACIGPAGESQVSYATLASDGGEHHAGRGGAGAVMGAKRCKAVVVRGESPSGLSALRERYAEQFEASGTGQWLSAGGTVETVDFTDEVGILPTRGWQESRFEDAVDIGVEAIRELATEREHPDRDQQGDFRVETDAGETVTRGAASLSLGAGLGIGDAEAVAELGGLCDRLGLDLVSTGSAIAWAIRASQAGLLDEEYEFGDVDTARSLVRAIATRDGDTGDRLADGVAAAVAATGGDEFVPTVKSMELPSYDPRGAESMALAYATSDRGGCHRRARPVERAVFEEWSVERIVDTVITEQNERAVLWSLIVDDFVGDVFEDLGEEWLDVVGLETAGSLATVGERIWTLTRLFNVREGFDRADDELPAALQRPVASGPNEGSVVDSGRFERMLDEYYAARGWSENGIPTAQTVARLDLTDALDGETPVAGSASGSEESS
ncbi:aldehyde ferredoxin oxidoreductase [Halovenus sp. WSH3]|uniref:Aldehyde ferredoxin oxidoreductase n=1 Tax=Halovenus carboxidivorans TaxID=2692199 RepID=A0A6B0T2R3_9EURY|nr:aldehyde ferredoxin oxidoreductase C-terminal domain-containing protein [Halovenus carboxidivorans]MXR52538.1 aldehyde ferredoxin oxidoreductase [Halovenus carboxidivorans]